jgi:hypothetical protein
MAYMNSEMTHGHRVVSDHSNQTNRDNDMANGMMIIVVGLASMIGIWGFSCIASGLFHSGGLIQLGSKWVSAVFGM